MSINNNEMKLEFKSKSVNESFARITVAAFVSQLDPTVEEIADIKTAVVTLEGLGVDGIGMNCGLGPDQMLELLKEMKEYSSTPIFIQPNAGLPVSVNGKTTFKVGETLSLVVTVPIPKLASLSTLGV